MPVERTRLWEVIGAWSGVAFLVAGGLVSVATVAMGLALVTEISQGLLTGLPTMVGLLVAYIGMLGLYPRLAARRRQAALTGIGLLLLPIVGIVVWLGHALVIGQEPSFAGLLVGVVIGGFVVGIGVLGVTSYRTRVPSRGVGLALLAFVVPWAVLFGSGIVYGGATPPWLDFVTTGTMGCILLVIGYLTWTAPPAMEHKGSTVDPTA